VRRSAFIKAAEGFLEREGAASYTRLGAEIDSVARAIVDRSQAVDPEPAVDK
jgi:hypothetical protein